MPDQIVPITQLDRNGVILDVPPVSLPPNVFTDARNVRFKDGAVRKMEGEVDIFPRLRRFLEEPDIGEIQYLAWWPNPNQTTLDRGYYITMVEHTVPNQEVEHFAYAFLPDDSDIYNIGRYTSTNIVDTEIVLNNSAEIPLPASQITQLNNLKNNPNRSFYLRITVGRNIINIDDITIDTSANALILTFQGRRIDWPVGILRIDRRNFIGYNRQGNWQHTLFNGGFSFIINNGVDKPAYITDPSGNTDIRELELNDLPGWDSYEVNALVLRDTFDAAVNSRVFDTGQLRVDGVSNYVVTILDTDGTVNRTLSEDTDGNNTVDPSLYRVTVENGQNVIELGSIAIASGQILQVNFRSETPVGVRASTVRAFGDFLVAGNLVEYALDSNGDIINNSIVRRLTGVVRSSDVASPGAIPNNWDPFAVGVSTADEFVIADTGIVQDMVALQGNLYLYTNTSISVMRLTGNATTPLAVQPVTDQYGALTTDAVLEYDGKHFVIGSDDIYLFGGHPGSIQSISDMKVRRSFFNRINPINENINNLFTLRYAARDEIWVCFPTVNSVRGECDEAYIWNYRTGAWTIRTLNSVVSGDIGPVPGGGTPSAIITVSGTSGSNGYATIGSNEVQSFRIDTDASVGHANAARPELLTFRTLRSVNSVDRPPIVGRAVHTAQIQIDTDVFAGPNPTQSSYELQDTDQSFTYNTGLLYGGAQLTGSITEENEGGSTTTSDVVISANEIFAGELPINETGTGDDLEVFDSGVSVTSTFSPEISDSISGDTESNPSGNNISVTTGTPNPVTQSSSLTNVSTQDGGSYTFTGSGTGSVTATSTFMLGGLSNGSVTAGFTTGTNINTLTGQSVSMTINNPPTSPGGLTQFKNAGRSAQVPAGISLVMADGTVYGPGTHLVNTQVNTIGAYGLSGSGVTTAHLREIFGTTGQNIRVTGSGTYVGSFSNRTPNASSPHYIAGPSPIPGLSNTSERSQITWNSTRGYIVGSALFNQTYASDPALTNWTVVGLTTRTTIHTLTLDEVTNNTNGSITFDWVGTDVTVAANDSELPNSTFTGGTNAVSQAWSFSGTAAGTRFINNSGFTLGSFIPTGLDSLASGGLDDGTGIDFPTRATTFTATTPTITVTNNNSTGSINFMTPDVLNFSLAAGSTMSNILNHSNNWSYIGNQNVRDNHTDVTFRNIGIYSIKNFTPNVVGGSVQVDDTGNFDTDDFETWRILNGDFRLTYQWSFTGVKVVSDQAIANDATITLGQFYARSAIAIRNGSVENMVNWNADTDADTDLVITSRIPGNRIVNDFTFSEFGVSVTDIDTDLGPHSNFTYLDNLGDELFSVSQTDNGDGTYTYEVTTNRNTGFTASDTIRDVQFRSGGLAYDPPDNIINIINSGYSFTSSSNTWTLRAAPAANYVQLDTETLSISGNSYNSNNIIVSENSITGGYSRSGVASEDTEGVNIVITDTTTTDSDAQVQFNFGAPLVNNANNVVWRLRPSQAVNIGGTQIPAGQVLTQAQMRTLLGTPNGGTFSSWSTAWGTSTNPYSITKTNTPSPITTIGLSGNTQTRFPGDNVAGLDWSPTVGGVHTALLFYVALSNFPLHRQAVCYTSDGDIRMFNAQASADFPDTVTNSFTGLVTPWWSNPAVWYIRVGGQTVQTVGRQFDVTNSNAYDISFSYQGGGQNSLVAAGDSETFSGAAGSTDQNWIWVNNAIDTDGLTGSGSEQGVTVTAVGSVVSSTLNNAPFDITNADLRTGGAYGPTPIPHRFIPTVPSGATYTIRGVQRSGGYQLTPLDNRSVFGGDASGINFQNADVTTAGGTVGITTPTFSNGFRYFTGSPGSNGYREYKDWPVAVASGANYANRILYRATSLRYNFEGVDAGPVDSNTNAGFTFLFARRANQPAAGSTTTNNIDASGPAGQMSLTGIRADGVQAMVTTETFTVVNPHPFPVTFTVSGSDINVPADSTITHVVNGSTNNPWGVSTPTDTEYQYSLLNNNVRPIDLLSGTWGTQSVQPSQTINSNFDTDRGFTASIYREFLNTGMPDVTSIPSITIDSGIGPINATQLPIGYRFTYTGVVDVIINLAEDTEDDSVPENVVIEMQIIAALQADSDFNKYFTINDQNDDSSIPAGRFDVTARAFPGDLFYPFGDTDRVQEAFPAGAVGFTAFNLQYGGRSGLNADINDSVDTDAVQINIDEGRSVFVNGVNQEINGNQTRLLVQGAYPSTDTDDRRLNEIVRQHFRKVTDVYTITDSDSENPSSLGLTSVNDGDHFLRVTSPTDSDLNPYLNVLTLQEGVGGASIDDIIYPSITIRSPQGQDYVVQLDPRVIRDTDTDQRSLNYQEIMQGIVSTVNAQSSTNRWFADTDLNSKPSGSGVLPTSGRIKFVRDTEENSSFNQWQFVSINYGNTGNTLANGTPDSDIGVININDFTRIDTDGDIDTDNLAATSLGTGDNLDFRGRAPVRATPTYIMVQITNSDFPSGIQYIPIIVGLIDSDLYNPATHTGNNRNLVNAESTVSLIQSAIINNNRRLNTTLNGTVLSILPVQYSEIANFVINLVTNDTAAGVTEWNDIVMNRMTDDEITQFFGTREAGLINTNDSQGGVASVASALAGTLDRQDSEDPSRIPNRSDNSSALATMAFDAAINIIFDPLRPWPTTQVNLNKEYPIFANSLLDAQTGGLTQSYRGGDIGFLYDTEAYESYVERVELALAPEFNTEEIHSLALHADGGTRESFNGPTRQAVLKIRTYGTDSPGFNAGQFNDTDLSGDNSFQIGDDYKMDIRTHGRFINYRITDKLSDSDTDNRLGTAWNLSGLQVDVSRGGRR